MISQLRKKIKENGSATLNEDDFNQLQIEWVKRVGIEDSPPKSISCVGTFEDTAKATKVDGQKMIGVWADGVMLSYDNEWCSNFTLVENQRYQVIINKIG